MGYKPIMYGISVYLHTFLHRHQPNVGKYSIVGKTTDTLVLMLKTSCSQVAQDADEDEDYDSEDEGQMLARYAQRCNTEIAENLRSVLLQLLGCLNTFLSTELFHIRNML